MKIIIIAAGSSTRLGKEIKDTDKVKKAIKKLKDEKLEPDKVVELILNLLKENK